MLTSPPHQSSKESNLKIVNMGWGNNIERSLVNGTRRHMQARSQDSGGVTFLPLDNILNLALLLGRFWSEK